MLRFSKKDLLPLDNLELFPMGLLLDLEIYRKIGRNAALYAQMHNPPTIPTIWDQSILQLRARAEPLVVILQQIEEANIINDKGCTELDIDLSLTEMNKK